MRRYASKDLADAQVRPVFLNILPCFGRTGDADTRSPVTDHPASYTAPPATIHECTANPPVSSGKTALRPSNRCLTRSAGRQRSYGPGDGSTGIGQFFRWASKLIWRAFSSVSS